MGEMTPDREKVVEAFACCCADQCGECPLNDDTGLRSHKPCAEFRRDEVTELPNTLVAGILAYTKRPPAVWQYYTNDEGKARWRCSECGKVRRRDPRDKKFCSACGAEMRMEC